MNVTYEGQQVTLERRQGVVANAQDRNNDGVPDGSVRIVLPTRLTLTTAAGALKGDWSVQVIASDASYLSMELRFLFADLNPPFAGVPTASDGTACGTGWLFAEWSNGSPSRLTLRFEHPQTRAICATYSAQSFTK